jgi:chorismate dehydratase
MSEKVKISIVSYLNSKPFLYGLERSEIMDEIDLSLDIPAVCAQKLLNHEVDLGLVPVAIIPLLQEHYVVGDYCIGAKGKVGSVMLYSSVPLTEIKTVLLDYQSRTSVNLVKVLAKHLWKINPVWEDAKVNFETKISGSTAAVIIGDRTFGIESKYTYSYDLSEEWEKLTGLPFVFACWVANKKLPGDILKKFNEALKYGLNNRSALIAELSEKVEYTTDVTDYLMHKIDYSLDANKREAMGLFLNYLKHL